MSFVGVSATPCRSVRFRPTAARCFYVHRPSRHTTPPHPLHRVLYPSRHMRVPSLLGDTRTGTRMLGQPRTPLHDCAPRVSTPELSRSPRTRTAVPRFLHSPPPKTGHLLRWPKTEGKKNPPGSQKHSHWQEIARALVIVHVKQVCAFRRVFLLCGWWRGYDALYRSRRFRLQVA